MLHLDKDEILRYSRQLLLPGFELERQTLLKNASAIIIGAGGLGCPVAMFLAAAGIGRIGIADYDKVDITNLHRQVLHTEPNIGVNKAQSIKSFINQANHSCKVDAIEKLIDSENALDILSQYDIVIDASDNMATRYLLNDVAVLLDKPLISGSALRWEGHLTVYNMKNNSDNTKGPCYRCLFPLPPESKFVTNCNDGGIIGCITGMIGSLQALEAIKILTGLESSYNGKMLIYNGLQGSHHVVRLRSRQATCPSCSQQSELRLYGLKKSYAEFCGSGACDAPKSLEYLSSDSRITVKMLKDMMMMMVDDKSKLNIIDVRSPIQYKICSLPESSNIPLSKLEKCIVSSFPDKSTRLICICRRGNDSQRAVLQLREYGYHNVMDVIGGLTAYAKEVDLQFPIY